MTVGELIEALSTHDLDLRVHAVADDIDFVVESLSGPKDHIFCAGELWLRP